HLTDRRRSDVFLTLYSGGPVSPLLKKPESPAALTLSVRFQLGFGLGVLGKGGALWTGLAQGYVLPDPMPRSCCDEYGAMPGLPCTPQPTRRRRSERGELRMKSSSERCHEAERPGNVDHLWPGANCDDPSKRNVPVTKYRFL